MIQRTLASALFVCTCWLLAGPASAAVTVALSPANNQTTYNGQCPINVQFNAVISGPAGSSVTYQFVRFVHNQLIKTPPVTMALAGASLAFNEIVTYDSTDAGSQTETLAVTSPNASSAAAHVTITCAVAMATPTATIAPHTMALSPRFIAPAPTPTPAGHPLPLGAMTNRNQANFLPAPLNPQIQHNPASVICFQKNVPESECTGSDNWLLTWTWPPDYPTVQGFTACLVSSPNGSGHPPECNSGVVQPAPIAGNQDAAQLYGYQGLLALAQIALVGAVLNGGGSDKVVGQYCLVVKVYTGSQTALYSSPACYTVSAPAQQ
jgi:hypothetical protein